MGIEVPGSVRWLSETVVGSDWPDADETAMLRLAHGWYEAASSLGEVTDESDAVIRTALGGIEGDVSIAIADRWARIGPEGALTEIIALCSALGESLEGASEDVRIAKLTIIAALVALAVELAAIAAATIMTAGAASPAAVVAQTATQIAVRMAIKQLVLSLLRRAAVGAAKGAAIGAGLEALKEAGLQTYEIHRDRRDGYDWGDVAESGGQGAVKGTVSGALNGAMGIGLLDPRKLLTGQAGAEVQGATVGETRFTDALIAEVAASTGIDEGIAEKRREFDELLDRLGP
ncbi:hypothetical protein ABIC28_000718 [Rhodococcus sp. PvR044]|jgi:hypothetical protein|uniref:WXG100-like domain-containing protein n=1 Tax=unclassified Rhodococcus (in: high G+C Gram-positive bacteria) TaxID=192944 RepID=UPI000BD964CC|nr:MULTISPECIES: hypothetical protein [unclassified Rhodococcus (in: high G+C Gram-positive bacteria)]MBP1157914.1 hypothetical protein [Rhodococcus sp. PvR099]PTR37853.1 hypothetical protein C8K38_119103 [Rhodococcus sp. OK611]SNX93284.1 hypothetical protein SAMN05447004_119103 [Rhodococcus sp. OK270]